MSPAACRGATRSVWISKAVQWSCPESWGISLIGANSGSPVAPRVPERVQVMAHINDLSAPLISHILRHVHDHGTWTKLCITSATMHVQMLWQSLPYPTSLLCVVQPGSFLGPKDCCRLSSTQKSWVNTGGDDPLWQTFCLDDFGVTRKLGIHGQSFQTFKWVL